MPVCNLPLSHLRPMLIQVLRCDPGRQVQAPRGSRRPRSGRGEEIVFESVQGTALERSDCAKLYIFGWLYPIAAGHVHRRYEVCLSILLETSRTLPCMITVASRNDTNTWCQLQSRQLPTEGSVTWIASVEPRHTHRMTSSSIVCGPVVSLVEDGYDYLEDAKNNNNSPLTRYAALQGIRPNAIK